MITSLLSLSAPVQHDARNTLFGSSLVRSFDAWKFTMGKTYGTAEAERAALAAYESNDRIIHTHNAKNLSYTLGHNEFSDLTWEQFHSMYISELFLNKPRKNAVQVHLTGIGQPLDDAVDWVAKGAVTPVKNQGHCGSCWAFSTTGSVEGAFQIAGNSLTSLSEQDLVSCDKMKDHGCQGGLMDNAFEYIQQNGITSEAEYPYSSGGGSAPSCTKHAPVVTISGHQDVTPGDEDALKSAVSKQPVSVAIEADKSAFQLYSGGVLDNAACGKKLDHGVLAVGYGTDGKDYWKEEQLARDLGRVGVHPHGPQQEPVRHRSAALLPDGRVQGGPLAADPADPAHPAGQHALRRPEERLPLRRDPGDDRGRVGRHVLRLVRPLQGVPDRRPRWRHRRAAVRAPGREDEQEVLRPHLLAIAPHRRPAGGGRPVRHQRLVQVRPARHGHLHVRRLGARRRATRGPPLSALAGSGRLFRAR